MALESVGSVVLPAHDEGGEFDHGVVHLDSGKVFVAHSTNASVEVVDGVTATHLATVGGCPDASGVICDQTTGRIFAAARGAGQVLVIDVVTHSLRSTIDVGTQPNGLAFDNRRGRLLVADTADQTARIADVALGKVELDIPLPGRPRWCVYDRDTDTYLIAIREPAFLLQMTPSGTMSRAIPMPSEGPHGVDFDSNRRRVFVACDGGEAVTVDLTFGEVGDRVDLPGAPDAIWFNQVRDRLYVAIGDPGVIAVVDTKWGRIAEEIETEPGAKTTAWDERRQRLYVFMPRSCAMEMYEER